MIFRIAWRSLLQHTRRTLFLGGAIAGVTMLLVVLTALSAGIKSTMLRSATTLMTGHINVGGFYKVTAGQAGPIVTDYDKVLAEVRKILPELESTVDRGRGWAKFISETGSTQLGIGGIEIDKEPTFRQVVRVKEGSLDGLREPGTVLLFDTQAERLGVKVGDAVTVSAPTSRGVNNTIDLRVVAVAHGMGLLSAWNCYVPAVTLRKLYQVKANATGAIHIHLPASLVPSAPKLAEKLRRGLTAAGYRLMDPEANPYWMKFEKVTREDWTGQKLDVTTWQDELAFFDWILTALDTLTVILVVVLMVIVVIGIMNTMWIAIRERTREIGALRAMGMHRGGVLGMFLVEALLLGLGGTLAGALAGWALASGLNAAAIAVPLDAQLIFMSDRLTLAVHGAALAAAIALISTITGLAALYPAIRAARLRPVEAMSHFG